MNNKVFTVYRLGKSTVTNFQCLDKAKKYVAMKTTKVNKWMQVYDQSCCSGYYYVNQDNTYLIDPRVSTSSNS